ncbi:Uncharacterised protein r2_g1910 [Pycnogonum litorale]
MEKVARPEKLQVSPSAPNASKQWKLWIRGFRYFLSLLKDVTSEDKLELLFLYVSSEVSDIIQEATSFDNAIILLEDAYVKPVNEVFARHLLSSRMQNESEPIDDFLQALNSLAGDCNFKAVTAVQNRSDSIRDAFIRGLSSNVIRTRLLENKTLTLDKAVDQARSLEHAQLTSESYLHAQSTHTSATVNTSNNNSLRDTQHDESSHKNHLHATKKNNEFKCFFCGGTRRHPRSSCPAREAMCRNCRKMGHWGVVCRSQRVTSSALQNENESMHLASCLISSSANGASSDTSSLNHSLMPAYILNMSVTALIDTGSSDNFINKNLVTALSLPVLPKAGYVSMASSDFRSKIDGCCKVSLDINDRNYDVCLSILPDLCADVILGTPFLERHEEVRLKYNGKEPLFNVCAASTLKVETPKLFSNIAPDCRPIVTKSRKFNPENRRFIESEIRKMLRTGIIEPSRSAWRAQPLVTTNSSGKKRLVVDFSQTINKFTELDAYPLPKIEEMVNDVARNKYFSVVDLSAAYYQVEIDPSERPFTAFEAAGDLYQFCRIPMGITNGVPAFQRVMNGFIKKFNLQKTYAYLDDVTIAGETVDEHERNLQRFLSAAKEANLTLNMTKSKFNLTSINLLGYSISNGRISPDPDRLAPLHNLLAPQDMKQLQRLLGFFAYYAKWIHKYSEKIQSLVNVKQFPLSGEQIEAIERIKQDITEATLTPINFEMPFTLETDASNTAIAATLSQNTRPVAFFSRTLTKSEQKSFHIIEKEAYSIIESIRKWRHLLVKHFTIVTDQRSVSFMFDRKAVSRIKNDKILRWRIELAQYSYSVSYRPGKENLSADALSRCNSLRCVTVLATAVAPIPVINPVVVHSLHNLRKIHIDLCHPGVTRLLHFVRRKNLPYSTEEVRKVCTSCEACCRLKPRFYKKPPTDLIKATSPFERLNVDFKGPIPSATRNKYFLTVVDEYSRFPFAFPCSDVSSKTVITCLTNLFVTFGLPKYIHSDRGAAFMSNDVKSFLLYNKVATSRTTPFHPTGNSQCERFNGIIWKTVQLALFSRNLKIEQWETVLPIALHSIRSLVCTSTNETPHERLFKHCRNSPTGPSLPTWLKPGPVLLRKFARNSKYEPLVEEVELLDVNEQYAHVKLPNGVTKTVSTSDLAPSANTHADPPSGVNDGPVSPPLLIATDSPTEPLPSIPSTTEPIFDTSIYKEVGYSAHPRTSERIVKSPKGQTDVISQPVTASDFDPRSPNEDSDYSVHPRRSERTVKPPTRLIDSM